jgi:phosphoglycolate phosphatase-like HAD superfamily hydrolase
MTNAVAIDLDGALGDTRGLWRAFLDDAARRYQAIAPLDVDGLPADRAEAAVELDRWAARGVGDWRQALLRYAEDHAPVHLRPSAGAAASLRTLANEGYRLGAFTDAPEELARIAVAQLGLTRRLEALEAGERALPRLLDRFGADDTIVATTLDDLATISTRGTQTA